jgi:branched-chain amino acid transport system permease protein
MPGYGFFEPVMIFTLLNVTMALGLYITALSGQLSMAAAAIAGVGGYMSGVLTVKFGVPFMPAVIAAAAAGGLVGATLAVLTAKMRDFILKLTTLAFREALSVLAFNWDYIGGANSFTGLRLETGLGTCIIAVLIALYVASRFDGSRLGFAAGRCAMIPLRRRRRGSRWPESASSRSLSVERSSAWPGQFRRIMCWSSAHPTWASSFR